MMAQRKIDASRKIPSCMTCNKRLPNIRYDTHTLCTRCRGQVCDLLVVCDECRDWTPEFRRDSLAYVRKLKQKRDWKRKHASGATTPLPMDVDNDGDDKSSEYDSEISSVLTSPVSGPSGVQPPIMPSPTAVPTVPPPYLVPPEIKHIVDAITAGFASLQQQNQGGSTQTELGSDRRGSTAIPSEIARPNPPIM